MISKLPVGELLAILDPVCFGIFNECRGLPFPEHAKI